MAQYKDALYLMKGSGEHLSDCIGERLPLNNQNPQASVNNGDLTPARVYLLLALGLTILSGALKPRRLIF